MLSPITVLLHDQRDGLATGADAIEEMDEQVAQPLLRRSARTIAPVFEIARQYLLIAGEKGGLEQLVLAVEVVIDHLLADAGDAHDLVQPRAGQPELGKLLPCRRQNEGPGAVGVPLTGAPLRRLRDSRFSWLRPCRARPRQWRRSVHSHSRPVPRFDRPAASGAEKRNRPD